MRLLHVVPTYLPARRYGGPIVAVHGLCKALAERGHRVDVFTTNVDGEGTLDVKLNEPIAMDGVKLRYFSSSVPRVYFSSAMRAALSSEIRNYDLVHIHAVYLWPGAAAARAARLASMPYVISPRGMLVPELIRAKSRIQKALWIRLVERRSFASAAAIHFTSQLEWNDATRVGLPLPSPFVVPNGIDLELRPPVEREENLLLFLGRISWKKRIDAIIEKLASLPGVRLVVAGNDDEHLTPRLRATADRLGVAARVDFIGPVYGASKNDLLARATLFVLPSQSENFGNAVLEALAMETPCVLSKEVGVACEVVDAGAGVIGLDEIEGLLADPRRRAEMGRQGRELVERRFTWPQVAQAMELAYQEVRESR